MTDQELNDKDLNPIHSPSEMVNLMDGIMTELNEKHINEAVARKLGWTGIYETTWESLIPGSDIPRYWLTKVGEYKGKVKPIPDYCHDIKAVWEIVEAIKPKYITLQCGGQLEEFRWICKIWHDKIIKGEVVEKADTAPMAICLAFLKLEDSKYTD